MAGDTGLGAQFTFGGITFNAAMCLQTTGTGQSLQVGQYQCSGVMKNAKGAAAYTFNASFAVDVSADSVLSAVDVGSTSAWTYHPFGTTAGRIKLTATRGLSTQMNLSAPVNGVVTVDFACNLDDFTIGAAT